MANFFTGSIYNYYSNLPKLKGILYAGNNISLLNNDVGYTLASSTVTTGSNTFRGNQTITGSLNLLGSFNHIGTYNHTGSIFSSGSNIFRGTQTVTGSLFTTGSNTLIGTTTLTGSFNVTGSTLQSGNNTLIGNTTLSGSITISGSSGPGAATASVQIYGDIRQSGYHRFDPVTTNIDTSISASYIYVSGSTNDLYFSQNGSGYNNVTRLRWIEGTLYTGLLHGGLIGSSSLTVYTISSGSGIIVNLNASFNNDPYPTIKFINWGTLSASIAPLSASFDQTFVAINNSGTITTQGIPFSDGQFDTLIPIGLVLHQNHSTINGFKTKPSLAYGWKQRSNVFVEAFGPLKLSGYALSVSGSSTGSLTVGSGTAFADGANYSIDPNNPSYASDSGTTVSKIFRYWQSGSDWVYDTNGGAGYGAINPAVYASQSAGGAVLTAVPGTGANREYSIQRCYWYPNSATKAVIVYYGNATYATQTDAIANIQFETFTEAPNTAANAIYLGALIVRNNADFTNITSYDISRGGLFRAVGGGGGGGGSTTPGGSSTQIQYNNGGGFAGVPVLTYDGTTLRATGSFTGSFTGSLFGTSSWANNSLTASFVQNAQTASYVLNAISSSRAITASYVLNAISSSYTATASFVTTLNQNIIITGSVAIGTGSIGNGENNLLLGPAPAGGTGEGGQLALLAKGDSYTSSSFLDTWQDQFRILRGPGATSNAGLMYMNLQSGNTQFIGAVTASGFSGLPNDYLYVTRNTTQTTGTNWVSQTIIFNNVIVSRGITYNTGSGVISLTGGKVYRITSRVAWSALASYTFEISCYDSASNQLGPVAQQLAPGNGSFNSSDGTLDFIYAPVSNISVQIKTTSNTTALSGESIRGDLNTQLIIQQIA